MNIIYTTTINDLLNLSNGTIFFAVKKRDDSSAFIIVSAKHCNGKESLAYIFWANNNDIELCLKTLETFLVSKKYPTQKGIYGNVLTTVLSYTVKQVFTFDLLRILGSDTIREFTGANVEVWANTDIDIVAILKDIKEQIMTNSGNSSLYQESELNVKLSDIKELLEAIQPKRKTKDKVE